MMDCKEIAKMLDGREYPFCLTKLEEEMLKKEGLVVVFGASDDLMEFRGAIEDELGGYGGMVAYLDGQGLLVNLCSEDACAYYAEKKKVAQTIRALWCDGGTAWSYRTNIPHETFRIVEDGEVYCVGIVFRLQDMIEAEINKREQDG